MYEAHKKTENTSSIKNVFLHKKSVLTELIVCNQSLQSILPIKSYLLFDLDLLRDPLIPVLTRPAWQLLIAFVLFLCVCRKSCRLIQHFLSSNVTHAKKMKPAQFSTWQLVPLIMIHDSTWRSAFLQRTLFWRPGDEWRSGIQQHRTGKTIMQKSVE